MLQIGIKKTIKEQILIKMPRHKMTINSARQYPLPAATSNKTLLMKVSSLFASFGQMCKFWGEAQQNTLTVLPRSPKPKRISEPFTPPPVVKTISEKKVSFKTSLEQPLRSQHFYLNIVKATAPAAEQGLWDKAIKGLNDGKLALLNYRLADVANKDLNYKNITQELVTLNDVTENRPKIMAKKREFYFNKLTRGTKDLLQNSNVQMMLNKIKNLSDDETEILKDKLTKQQTARTPSQEKQKMIADKYKDHPYIRQNSNIKPSAINYKDIINVLKPGFLQAVQSIREDIKKSKQTHDALQRYTLLANRRKEQNIDHFAKERQYAHAAGIKK